CLLRHFRLPDYAPAHRRTRTPSPHQPDALLPAPNASDLSTVLRARRRAALRADDGLAAAGAARCGACALLHVELLPRPVVVHGPHVVSFRRRAVLSAVARRDDPGRNAQGNRRRRMCRSARTDRPDRILGADALGWRRNTKSIRNRR